MKDRRQSVAIFHAIEREKRALARAQAQRRVELPLPKRKLLKKKKSSSSVGVIVPRTKLSELLREVRLQAPVLLGRGERLLQSEDL